MRQQMQTAEDYEALMPEPETFQAPARPSGRMTHEALAFEAERLADQCRASHPTLADALRALAAIAESARQADDNQLSLLTNQPIYADATACTDESEPHPLGARRVA